MDTVDEINIGMAGRAERCVRGYSKGMRQRVKLGQALHFLGRTAEARQHEQRFRELDAEEEIEQKKNPMNR